jgi:Predicted phosphatases
VHFLSLELPRRKGKLLPGVLELLERLKSRPHVVLALLTGNVSRGARLKLEHYGVWHFFEFGAFADDHRDRNELGRFARARAKEKHGREFARPRSTSLATLRATSRAEKPSARERSRSQREDGAGMTLQSISRIF